jgi:hypothetical protein
MMESSLPNGDVEVSDCGLVLRDLESGQSALLEYESSAGRQKIGVGWPRSL